MISKLAWYVTCAVIVTAAGKTLFASMRVALDRVVSGEPYGPALRLVWVSGALLIGVLLALSAKEKRNEGH